MVSHARHGGQVPGYQTIAAEITRQPPKIEGLRHIATVNPTRSEAQASR